MRSRGLLEAWGAALLLLLLSSSPAAGVSSAQQLISAALQYTAANGSPAVPPPNGAGIKFANDSTKVFASVSPPAGQLYAPPGPPPLPPCWSFLKAQTFDLPGQWVNHHDDAYRGEYDMTADCPAWLHDYDCQHPPPSEHVDPAAIKQEYRKIFQPDECALAQIDPTSFAAKLGAGRRIIMLGDSLMRLHFYSLACLLRDHITAGSSGVWDASSIRWKGDYNFDWGGGQNGTVAKQFVGEFHLASGGAVYLRDTGQYNQSLFDDLLSDFGPLTPSDVLIVNWSAWYHRFQWGLSEVAWAAWQKDMYQLFTERLCKLSAQVFWKQHVPPHFGGPSGTETGIENRFPGGPWRYYCEPTTVGESWYEDYIKYQLQGPLKAQCGQVRVLPIFQMTLPRYLSHHGSLGRGAEEGSADCRHWCNNVVDQWSIVFYNMLM